MRSFLIFFLGFCSASSSSSPGLDISYDDSDSSVFDSDFSYDQRSSLAWWDCWDCSVAKESSFLTTSQVWRLSNSDGYSTSIVLSDEQPGKLTFSDSDYQLSIGFDKPVVLKSDANVKIFITKNFECNEALALLEEEDAVVIWCYLGAGPQKKAGSNFVGNLSVSDGSNYSIYSDKGIVEKDVWPLNKITSSKAGFFPDVVFPHSSALDIGGKVVVTNGDDGSQSFYRQVERMTYAKGTTERIRFEGRVVKSEVDGFVDPEFPGGFNAVGEAGRESIFWVRASDLYPGVPLQRDETCGNGCNVMQGSVGDCQLLSAMACSKMQNIRELEQGKYEVKFFIHDESSDSGGSWLPVVVDDYLPCKQVLKESYWFFEPVFAKHSSPTADNFSLQMLLIEKAMAKHRGGYPQLKGLAAYNFLTGNPVQRCMTQVKDAICVSDFVGVSWTSEKASFDVDRKHFPDFLLKASNASPVMVAGCFIPKAKSNLYAPHAYSILKIAYVRATDLKNKNVLVAQLRNPHGRNLRGQPGILRISDSLEKTHFEETFNCSEKKCFSDGIFYMSYAELIENFEMIFISDKTMASNQKMCGK